MNASAPSTFTMARGLSQRALNVAWLAGLGVSAGASVLSAANGRPPEVFLPVGISGAVYATSGYVMARSRPANPIGYALLLVVAAAAGLAALRYLVPALAVVNEAFGPFSAVLVAFVLLAYPSGTLQGRAARVVIASITVVFALLAVGYLLTLEPEPHLGMRCPCAPNPLRLTDLSVFPFFNGLNSLAVFASGAAVSVLCVRRWWLARGTARRVLAPVLFGGVVTAVAFTTVGFVYATGGEIPRWVQAIFIIQMLIPIGLAITFVRVYTARGAVASAIVQLGASPSTEGLEGALRRTLGDPDLLVARWSQAAGAYLDLEGRRVDLDALDRERAALRLERDGQPLAAVVHDAALAVDPLLVESVADAVRFAVDTTEMSDRLRASGGDVAGLPRGEVAFLFGDIEGSTEMLSRLGDRYIDVLAELRRVVRDAAERNTGRVVELRADECFVAFANPAMALASAADIQRRLGEAAWPAGEKPLLRIGLHLGRPEITPDGYVGLDVHRAARVMSAANGGQILVSGALATAVHDRVPADETLIPLGYFSLKGIAEPEFLYRVATAGARSDAPPRATPA